MAIVLSCPLCRYDHKDEEELTLHIELTHYADDSVFSKSATVDVGTCRGDENNSFRGSSTVSPRQSEDDGYLLCPEEGCGEQVRLNDLQQHLDLHIAENFDPSRDILDDGGEINADSSMYVPHYSSSYPPCLAQQRRQERIHLSQQSLGNPSGHHLSENYGDLPRPSPHIENDKLGFDPTPTDPRPAEIFACVPSFAPVSVSRFIQDHQHHQQTIAWCREQSAIWNGQTLGSIAHTLTYRKRPHVSDSYDRVDLERSVTSVHATQRLGKAQLGPHAFEERMPHDMFVRLQKGAKRRRIQHISSSGQLCSTFEVENEVRLMIPVLERLLAGDGTVAYSWLCHERALHVHKMKDEGHFCGYRNIQMMLSFILSTNTTGASEVVARLVSSGLAPDHLPDIILLQDWIEQAWDSGFNNRGRIETGGILGTRKYIGTPEAEALFQALSIPHTIKKFTDVSFPGGSNSNRNCLAYEALLDEVEQYFSASAVARPPTKSRQSKVTRTSRPPIFLQQPGHSMTIVGIERLINGARNILVFDPGYRPSPGIRRLLEMSRPSSNKGFVTPSSPKLKKQAAPYSSVNVTSLRGNGTIDAWVRRRHGSHEKPSPSNKSVSSDDSRDFPVGKFPGQHVGHYSPVASPSKTSATRVKGWVREKHTWQHSKLLDAYRRGARSLRRYRGFEILMLEGLDLEGDANGAWEQG